MKATTMNTSKLIPILITTIIVLIGALMMYQNLVNDQNEQEVLVDNQVDAEHSDTYYDIMSMDFVNAYPPGYLEVVEANSEIVLYQYGEEVQNSEAEDIIAKQRELFASELLELNSFEHQVEGYLNEVSRFRTMDRYIISRRTVSSEILAYDGNIAQVTVDEQYSDGLGVQYTYYLTKENDDWKIISYERKVTSSVAHPDVELGSSGDK